MANANILFNKRIRVDQTSTLTDSSRSYLNTDRLESVKPQHRPTRVGQICFYPPITYPWSHSWASVPADCGSTIGEKYTGRRWLRDVAEIYGGWPLAKKLTESLRTEGPLGADDLALATRGIREDIQLAQNELGKELNVRGLAQAENRLSHRV